MTPEPRRSPLRIRHPFFRRLQWNPFVVAVPLAVLGYTTDLNGFPVGRPRRSSPSGSGCRRSTWRAGTGWLDSLYSDEAEPTRDVEA